MKLFPNLSLVLLCFLVQLHAETVDSSLKMMPTKAAHWANTVVNTTSQKEAIACANCVYLSLHVVKLDAIIRNSMRNILALTVNLHVATARYEQNGETIAELKKAVETFSSVMNYNNLVVQKWQQCTAYCQNAPNTHVQTAITELIDHAALSAVQQEKKLLISLAQDTHKKLELIIEKIDTVTDQYQIIGDAPIPSSCDNEHSIQELPLSESFAASCQELTICGLALLHAAEQGLDHVAYELQNGPAEVFQAYYTEFFKAYKKRYGKNAQVPFAFAPNKTQDKQSFIPDPTE